jgi:hypothetical protein
MLITCCYFRREGAIPPSLNSNGVEMAHGRNKYQSRENRALVREILRRDWDPIGIRGVPEASDEYDSYADKAYVMLMDERATSEAIAAYLYQIAADHMGLGHHARIEEASKSVAETLVTLRPQFGMH